MGTLLSYSGLSTKIRAMQSRLMTEKQYQEIAQMESVTQVVAYLKDSLDLQSCGRISMKAVCIVERLKNF